MSADLGLRPIRGQLDRYFEIDARGSTVRIELLGGLSTFVAMSYIVVVNPAILAQGGIPWSAAFLATALVGGFATVAMGLWARLPFAVAPGMEVNAFVVFTVIGTYSFSWPEALGLVFWSGLLMLAVTALGWRRRVIEAIPDEVRTGLIVSVAVFIAVVAFDVAGVLDGFTTFGARVLTEPGTVALYIGFFLSCMLRWLRIRAAILISIAVAAVYSAVSGLTATMPALGDPTTAWWSLDLGVVFQPSAWGLAFVLFALDFFGSVAKIIGLSANTSLRNGRTVPGMREALYVDSGASIGGAALGSTSFVTFVESGVGIRAGARTGLAAITSGFLLLSCVGFTSIVGLIPVEAVSGALLFVAISTVPSRAELRPLGWRGLSVGGAMVLVTAATGGLDQGLLAGLLIYLMTTVRQAVTGKSVLLAVSLLLCGSVILQYIS